jgi:hypothetical protein
MAAAENLMAGGIPPSVAKQIGLETPQTGLTATGTTQGTALTLNSNYATFTTVAANSGCIISTDKDSYVYNGGLNALTVYPGTAAQGFNFAGLAAGTGISVPANKGAYFVPARSGSIATIISA